MDIPRYLLIAASAALVIMLLGEWTSFKEERTESQDRSRLAGTSFEEPTPSSNLAMDNDGQVLDTLGEATTTENTSTAVSDDIPTITNVAAGEQKAPETATDSNRLVTVTTDYLVVVIDLQGGDIIEAALPEFPDNIEQPDVPFVLLEQNNTRTYIAQSGLVGPDGIDSPKRAMYTTAQNSYRLSGSGAQTVVLTTRDTANAVDIEKRYTFTPGSYLIELEYEIRNNGSNRWRAVPFAQLKRDSSQPPEADTSGFGMQPFLGAATTTPDDRFKKFTFGDIADDPWKANLPGGWIALMQHYFVTAWVPSQEQSHTYATRQTAAGFNIAGFTSPAITVEPQSVASYNVELYVGPKDQYVLEEVSPYLELTVDYGWLWWIGKPLFWLLTQIQSVVQNWGVAIILLTVLVKGAFFKLSATSYRSMAKMRKVQPKMQNIREQYADDKQKQSQAMMELYKKEKINPMGGCLPILIQMPVFIALYWVLMESVELRQAPFALWIQDLSVMDPYFVLPILMGASMFFMQKLNPPPPDPMQAKIMQWLPVIFTFFFLWFPAGLVLYWVVNNLLSMTQQWIITRGIEREGLKT